jgi:transposase-like protein
LSHFLGRGRYERCQGQSNHRNGSYGRHFTLKGIGNVGIRIPRDREGEYNREIAKVNTIRRSSPAASSMRMHSGKIFV